MAANHCCQHFQRRSKPFRQATYGVWCSLVGSSTYPLPAQPTTPRFRRALTQLRERGNRGLFASDANVTALFLSQSLLLPVTHVAEGVWEQAMSELERHWQAVLLM